MLKKDFAEIKTYLSRDRLQAYVPNGSIKRQLAEYKRNLKICKNLYPLLQYFEISFRNAIDKSLTNFVGGNEWMSAPFLDDASLRKIREAKKILAKQNKTATHDRIIAELSLGFWTSLFSKRYSQCKFQTTLVKDVFQYCPKSLRAIKNLQIYLDNVRVLRNKVCHYKRICHYNIRQTKTDILTYIAWISPAVHGLARKSV